MKIHQLAFIWNLVIKEELTNYNANIISIKAGLSIKMTDSEDYEEVNLHIYQKLIQKFIYLLYSTRLDIAFVIGQLSKYNSDLRKNHLQVTKRVVRYLKSIMDMSSIFGREIANCFLREPPPYSLVKYPDSNFAENSENWKLVIDYYFFLNRAVIL